MDRLRLFVIGASSGGVRALQVLAAQLPAGFPAAVLVVQHIGTHPSILPQLLTKNGRLPASHAIDRERIEPGRIHVAPPDCHMLVEGPLIRLSQASKEHHTRPAIDPLFRSAAVAWGPAVVGVLLTGALDDGTAGLQAVKGCGGVAIVQDPADAESSSMPLSAIRYVEVDHVVALAQMGALLTSLAASPPAAAAIPRPRIVEENEILLGRGDFMEHMKAIGKPSTFVCPDCNGSLWEIDAMKPRRYRCHTGHAFTLRSLGHAQSESVDTALWSALRALQEKEMLLRMLADSHRSEAREAQAQEIAAEAERIAADGATLRRMIESLPTPPE